MGNQIPRKWQLKLGDQRVVFVKGGTESAEHVIMKALLWALYKPTYPDLTIEIRIGDRYKPDLVSRTDQGEPLFWGESGKVSPAKIYSLGRRYPHTHFAMAKWDTHLAPYQDIILKQFEGLKRLAPYDLIRVPPDSLTRFIDPNNQIHITFDDVDWLRIEP